MGKEVTQTCPHCKGDEYVSHFPGGKIVCGECRGSGKVRVDSVTGKILGPAPK
jgi:DnaJ-class molecular chaperone